jgi:hypothetical protein
MPTSCSPMAFWSDPLQQLSEIAVTFQLQSVPRERQPPASGV